MAVFKREKKLKILFDIGHPAHLNFFRNAVSLLRKNNEIIITCIDRGRLKFIVSNEMPLHNINVVGKRKSTLVSILLQANFIRFFKMLILLARDRPDLCFSVGSFVLGFACKLLSIPNYQFDDDPERSVNVFLENISSDKLFFPPIISSTGNIENFNSLKEWAYLSPEYFRPDDTVLNEFGLVRSRYIFVREIDNSSLNYKGQDKAITSVLGSVIGNNYKVVFSLENKNDISLYPPEWILLNEPVRNIHSLMYYSRLIVSSGDSMAREGAMLGIPSVYCGYRKMKANDFISCETPFYQVSPEDLSLVVSKLLTVNLQPESQDIIRNNLDKKWDDVTKLICSLANGQL